MAQEWADTAAVMALVPFCVAKAEQMSEQGTLAKVKADDSAFFRSDLVMKAGSATVGDSKRQRARHRLCEYAASREAGRIAPAMVRN